MKFTALALLVFVLTGCDGWFVDYEVKRMLNLEVIYLIEKEERLKRENALVPCRRGWQDRCYPRSR